jgi:hypothetical protein
VTGSTWSVYAGLFKWVWIAVAAVLHLVVYGSLLWTAYTQAVKAGAEYEWVAKAGVPMCAFFMLDKWAEYLQHQHVAPITGEFTCRLFLVLGAGMCSIVLCAVHVWKTIASNRLWLAAAAAVAAVGVGVAMGSSYKPGD